MGGGDWLRYESASVGRGGRKELLEAIEIEIIRLVSCEEEEEGEIMSSSHGIPSLITRDQRTYLLGKECIVAVSEQRAGHHPRRIPAFDACYRLC